MLNPTPEQLRTITLKVNGTTHTAAVPVRKTLLDFVREDLMLTGSHAGCEHGVCGCCNVRLDGELVRSCILLAVQADGREVTTIEGLGTVKQYAPGTESLCRASRPAMRLLHPRHDYGRVIPAGNQPAAHRLGNPRSHRREPLPVYRLYADS